MDRLATVGVYGFSGKTFLAALVDADVQLVLDVRQRRGVRGPDYAWANSLRLQAALAAAGIAYRHLRELAPTTELRQLQYREDALANVGKRNRVVLAPEYVRRYTGEILAKVDLPAVWHALPPVACAALLCVERDAQACHRSLVARRIAEELGLRAAELNPGGTVASGRGTV